MQIETTETLRHGERKFASSPSLRASAVIGLLLSLCCISAGPLKSIQTQYYVLHTDVDTDFAKDLALRLDAMYKEYARRLVSFKAQGAVEPFNVYVFQNKKDYTRLTQNRFPNTGGIFISNQNLLAGFVEGQGRDATRRTLQHEAFHQFAYQMISPNLPVWLNEGLAQIFEEGIFTGKEFVLGQVPPRRIRQLQSDMAEGRMLDFRKMLLMSDEAWAENLKDRTTAAAQYNQVWAMVHFLVYATNEDGGPLYRDRLISLLTKIHNGQNSQKAFIESFGANIDGFQQRFTEYAAQLSATHAATYIEHQDVLADMLVALKKDGKDFSTIAEFREQVEKGRYRIEYRKGQLVWSTEKDPNVYFKDLTGQPMSTDRLMFSSRAGAPCPDIICRPTDDAQLRTIFNYNDGQIEHETVVEPTNTR